MYVPTFEIELVQSCREDCSLTRGEHTLLAEDGRGEGQGRDGTIHCEERMKKFIQELEGREG